MWIWCPPILLPPNSRIILYEGNFSSLHIAIVLQQQYLSRYGNLNGKWDKMPYQLLIHSNRMYGGHATHKCFRHFMAHKHDDAAIYTVHSAWNRKRKKSSAIQQFAPLLFIIHFPVFFFSFNFYSVRDELTANCMHINTFGKWISKLWWCYCRITLRHPPCCAATFCDAFSSREPNADSINTWAILFATPLPVLMRMRNDGRPVIVVETFVATDELHMNMWTAIK